jgi:hypothetical protein
MNQDTFFRIAASYTFFDHERNEIYKEWKVEAVEKKLRRLKQNWL